MILSLFIIKLNYYNIEYIKHIIIIENFSIIYKYGTEKLVDKK